MLEKFQPVLKLLNKSFGVWDIKGIEVEPRYWMAIALAVTAFLALLTMARLRYLYIHWSLSKPSLAMIFWGFILAILFEAMFLVFGKTIFTEILGMKNAPKPLSTILEITRGRLVKVMGAEVEYQTPTYKSVIEDYESLSDKEKQMSSDYICK